MNQENPANAKRPDAISFWEWIRCRARATLSFFGWLYLARIALLGLAVFIGLPLGAHGALRMLAIGAYDLHGAWWAFFVGLLLPFAAWAVFVTAAMVFAYGARRSRFDVQTPPEWMIPAWRYAVGAAVAVNAWTIFGATDRGDRLWVTVSVCGGLLVGAFVVAVLEEFHRLCSRTWIGGNLYLLPFRAEKVLLREMARRQRLMIRSDPLEWLSRGYGERGDDGKWRLMPGHGVLVIGTIVFLTVNAAIYVLSYNSTAEMMALVYLLVLFTASVLVGGAASFFLDAYRLPFLTVCVLWLLLASQKEDSDHYYRIWPRVGGAAKAEEVLTPANVLEKAVEAGRPIVLVAIAGGGIQSAAWGTRVLTGIEELIPEARKAKAYGADLPDFAGSVQCISGVSGGSTGAMFFVAGYGPDGLPSPRPKKPENPAVNADLLHGIVDAAEDTSLGQAVWGMAYPDARRAWVPLFIGNDYLDRAERMELKWAANGAQHMGQFGKALKTVSLTDWQKDVAQGIRPATIFNGTIVETGERICFSTAPVRSYFEGQREFVSVPPADGSGDEAEIYPGADLRVTTAARLSATFPLISSASRPLLALHMHDPKGLLMPPHELWKHIPGGNGLLHVVDGGYYENTGLGSLAQWLDDGLSELAKHPERKWPRSILILQIEAFPEVDAGDQSDPQAQDASGRGTIFQIASPLEALYNVRSAGHTASALRLIQTMQLRWNPLGAQEGKVSAETGSTCAIHLVRFTIPMLPHDPSERRPWEPAWFDAKSDKPPLSWHLREIEKQEIEKAWQAFHAEAGTLHDTPVPPPAFSPSADMNPQDPGAYPVENVLHFLKTVQDEIRTPASKP
ncbi:MAG: hypothetical protein ABI318_15925 [Chthoniobacteraceae bacterium]